MPWASSLSTSLLSLAELLGGVCEAGCFPGGCGLLPLLLLLASDALSGLREAGGFFAFAFFFKLPLPRGSKLPDWLTDVLFSFRSGRGSKGFDPDVLSWAAERAPLSTGAALEDAAACPCEPSLEASF